MTFRVTWTAIVRCLRVRRRPRPQRQLQHRGADHRDVGEPVGQSFRYLRLYVTADASSQAEVDSLVVNGTSAGSSWVLANGSQTSYVDAGSASAWTVTGRLRFPAAGSAAESPRVEVALGGTDTTPPTAPGSLAATSPTSGSPSLTWTAATDASGIASYRVSRDGSLLATVATTSYGDGTAAEGSRAYSVVAVDNAGNASSAATVTVVVDRTAPPVVTGLAGHPRPGTGRAGVDGERGRRARTS